MRNFFLAMAVLLCCGACSPVQATGDSIGDVSGDPTTPSQPQRCGNPRRVVVGIDRSGSFQSAALSVDQIAGLIQRSACPADEWYLRWIEADSYPPAAAIATIQFVSVPQRPEQPANVFDRRGYRRQLQAWTLSARRFAAQRREAAAQLRQHVPATAGATDLYGFLLKADELLADTPSGISPLVIMATDLEDTLGRPAPFNLRGAPVLVLAFEAENAVSTPSLRASWEQALRSSNAGAVVVRDVTEPFPGDLDALDLIGREGGS